MSGPDHISDFLGRTTIHGVEYTIRRNTTLWDEYCTEEWVIAPATKREARRRAPTRKQLLIHLVCEHDTTHEIWALLKSMCGDYVYGKVKMLRRIQACRVTYDPQDRSFTLYNANNEIRY